MLKKEHQGMISVRAVFDGGEGSSSPGLECDDGPVVYSIFTCRNKMECSLKIPLFKARKRQYQPIFSLWQAGESMSVRCWDSR